MKLWTLVIAFINWVIWSLWCHASAGRTDYQWGCVFCLLDGGGFCGQYSGALLSLCRPAYRMELVDASSLWGPNALLFPAGFSFLNSANGVPWVSLCLRIKCVTILNSATFHWWMPSLVVSSGSWWYIETIWLLSKTFESSDFSCFLCLWDILQTF